MKKKLSSLLAVALLTISVIPAINLASDLNNGVELDISSIKKLYSLDSVIGEINYLFKQGGVSIDNNIVVTGKDGFLFLGNNYDRVTDLHRGFINKDSEIKNTITELVYKQHFFNDLSIDNIFIIAPDKYTVYSDKLPSWLVPADKLPADYFMDRAYKYGLNALFLKGYFNSNDFLSYYKTDTHWNPYGAYIGYKASIDYLNKVYGRNIQKIETLSFSLAEQEGGDLSNFMKYSHHITDYEAVFDHVFGEIKKCQYNLSNYSLSNCEDKVNSVTRTNQRAYYTKNDTALNDKKLLFLKDSFGTANSIYYQETFRETIQIHYNQLQGNDFLQLVLNEKPDLIIYQVVERGFYNAGYARPWNENLIKTKYIDNKKTINKSFKSSRFNQFINVKAISRTKVELTTQPGDPFFVLNLADIKCDFDTLSIAFNSSITGELQVFYKTKDSNSYNELNSTRVKIDIGMNKIALKISDQVLRDDLRVDLPEVGGVFVFSDFSFLTDNNESMAKECP